MKKKVFMHIWILMIVMCIAFGINSNTAKAASKLEIKVKKSISVRPTEHKAIKVSVYRDGKYISDIDSGELDIYYKVSNKSVVSVNTDPEEVGDSEYLGIYPKKAGKSVITITAIYSSSYWDEEKQEEFYKPELRTTAKCTVNVQYFKSLRAHACLLDYDTRNNEFVIKVKNISNKNITILSNGAKARDCDYKSYDRKLRIKGKSKVVIKPGQTKKIRFKVIGRLTWYNHEDFEIRSYWKWGKKKYLVSIDSNEGAYVKSGKKWKWISYVDEHWFSYDDE